jgi:hypothetical protein
VIEIKALAKQLVQKGQAPTPEQAFVKVLEQRPDLEAKYREANYG